MRTGRLKVVGVVLFVIALALSVFMVPTAMADPDVCDGTKFDANQLPKTVEGVEITVDGAGAHFDLPDDVTSALVCVKGGNENSTPPGGTTTLEIFEDTTVPVKGGHALSHASVISVTRGESETFEICHEEEDGTFTLLDDLTEGQLAEHEAHEGDADPDEDGECPAVTEGTPPDDDVGGTRFDRPTKDPKVGDEVAGKRVVKGRALPFTGIDPAPFIALSGLLAASGASALVIARRK
ncbi:MAG: hypothetical protein GEU78_03465 [Actinobacteria bacterium]|nr:hypothetical protein [Actinomycetota bacterium]